MKRKKQANSEPPADAAVYLLHLFDAGLPVTVRRAIATVQYARNRPDAYMAKYTRHKPKHIADAIAAIGEGVDSTLETGYTVADVSDGAL